MHYWIIFCPIFELFVKWCLSCALWSEPQLTQQDCSFTTLFCKVILPPLSVSDRKNWYGHHCKPELRKTFSLILLLNFRGWSCSLGGTYSAPLFVLACFAKTYFAQTVFEQLILFFFNIFNEKCQFYRDFFQLILPGLTDKGEMKNQGFTSVSLNKSWG